MMAIIIFGCILLVLGLVFIFMWLYQKQEMKDLEKAMQWVEHSPIQYFKATKKP